MEGNLILRKLTIGLFVILILVAAAGYWKSNYVPFGTFKLVKAVSDNSGQRNAAIFEFLDGESSARLGAVWLLEGNFKEITEEDLKGRPALIWPLAQHMPRIAWQDNGRLLVEVEAPIDFHTQISFSCYSPDREPERPYLCSSSNKIDLLVTKQKPDSVPK